MLKLHFKLKSYYKTLLYEVSKKKAGDPFFFAKKKLHFCRVLEMIKKGKNEANLSTH